MRFTAPVRMPLQTGATALKTGMFALMLIPFMWGVWPILVIFLMWSDARRRRASDIVFEEGGYRLEGGRLGGWVSAAWEQIDPKTVSVQETNELFVKVGDNPAQMIWRLTSDGDVLAESGDLDESRRCASSRRSSARQPAFSRRR